MIGQKRVKKGRNSAPGGALFLFPRNSLFPTSNGQKWPVLVIFNVKYALLRLQKGIFNPGLDYPSGKNGQEWPLAIP